MFIIFFTLIPTALPVPYPLASFPGVVKCVLLFLCIYVNAPELIMPYILFLTFFFTLSIKLLNSLHGFMCRYISLLMTST